MKPMTKTETQTPELPEEIYAGSFTNGAIAYCSAGRWAGWIFWKHPDGQWVSLAKVPDHADRPAAMSGDAWLPIETAPEYTRILVRWSMRVCDDDGMPTGEITSTYTVIAEKRGNWWEDFGAMENTSADFRGDLDETAHEPDSWMPLPDALTAPVVSDVADLEEIKAALEFYSRYEEYAPLGDVTNDLGEVAREALTLLSGLIEKAENKREVEPHHEAPNRYWLIEQPGLDDDDDHKRIHTTDLDVYPDAIILGEYQLVGDKNER